MMSLVKIDDMNPPVKLNTLFIWILHVTVLFKEQNEIQRFYKVHKKVRYIQGCN